MESALHYRSSLCIEATIGVQRSLYVICGRARCLGDTSIASLVLEMEVSFAVEIRGRIANGRRKLVCIVTSFGVSILCCK